MEPRLYMSGHAGHLLMHCISDSSKLDNGICSCALGRYRVCDPVPFGGVHNTFSSDYSPSALDSIGQTHSEVSVSPLSTDESVSCVLAHGAKAGSSRAPHFDGANR
jgi:hypothetical protein